MQNVQLLGVQHMDRFNMRASFVVIGIFGIITLISYINELAKSGLLFGGPHAQIGRQFRWADSVGSVGHAHVLMQKTGDRHKLDLNIIPLQSLANSSLEGINERPQKTGQDSEDQEIEIHLHLGKQKNYVTNNKTETQIYQFHNVMPNFFAHMNKTVSTLSNISNFTHLDKKTRQPFQTEYKNFTDYLHQQLMNYQNRTKVMFYQHDQGGYASRDCFVHLAVTEELVTGRAPLSAIYRKDWEAMARSQRQKYEVLYGGLSFGACEGLGRPCSYFAMVSHPLDRLLHVYSLCKGNGSRTMCKFLRVENSTNVMQFLKSHGSSMFQKLLYYSRHCRLVGNNEICINDNNAYFVLSSQEKRAYLENILDNLENWFSVVGIMEERTASLKMFESVIGLDFMKCLTLTPRDKLQQKEFATIFHNFHYFKHVQHKDKAHKKVDNLPYLDLRDQLQSSSLVKQWLHADLKIYEKIVEIFHRQQRTFNELIKKLTYFYYPKAKHDVQSSNVQNNTKNVSIASSALEMGQKINMSDSVKPNVANVTRAYTSYSSELTSKSLENTTLGDLRKIDKFPNKTEIEDQVVKALDGNINKAEMPSLEVKDNITAAIFKEDTHFDTGENLRNYSKLGESQVNDVKLEINSSGLEVKKLSNDILPSRTGSDNTTLSETASWFSDLNDKPKPKKRKGRKRPAENRKRSRQRLHQKPRKSVQENRHDRVIDYN